MADQPGQPGYSDEPEPPSAEGEEDANPDEHPDERPDEHSDEHPDDHPDDPDEAGPPPRRRAAARRLIATALVVVVAAGLAITGWLAWQLVDELQRDPSRAGPGDCLAGPDDPGELRRVDCDAAEARWRVAGTEPGLAWAEFQQVPEDELCADHPDTELAVWFGADRERGTGDVFCLEPVD